VLLEAQPDARATAGATLLDEKLALPKKIEIAALFSGRFTPCSKLATRRLVTPNSWKNSL
jgi:hypothetical protein